jgi:hypothetical protein
MVCARREGAKSGTCTAQCTAPSLMASDYSTCTVSDPAKDRHLQPYCGKMQLEGHITRCILVWEVRGFEVRGSRFLLY